MTSIALTSNASSCTLPSAVQHVCQHHGITCNQAPHRSASKLFSASQPSAPHDANPFMDEGVAARCDAAPTHPHRKA